MVTTLLLVVFVVSLPMTFLGSLVLYYTLIKPKKPPMDESNRINHLRMVWFVMRLRDPGLYVKIYPWLKNDEGENLK